MRMKPRMLVACEFSGVVRRAFRAKGWDAWSCDLLPSEDDSPHHIQGDVTTILDDGWDLIIAHPPCTYLCNSGVRWLSSGGKLNPERHHAMMRGCDLFAHIYFADCPRIAIENPVMHKYAKDYLQSAWKIPSFTQSIQPWQFGVGETKRTCLWLQNLPPLRETRIVAGRNPKVHHASPGPDRWKLRSVTCDGIAQAMAEQWTK